MNAKRWLQFAACVLLLLNAGCDFDNSSHTFADTGIAKFDRHENDTGRLNHSVHSGSQERDKNHLVRQPTQKELRESLDRINKVISRIEKVLVAQQ